MRSPNTLPEVHIFQKGTSPIFVYGRNEMSPLLIPEGKLGCYSSPESDGKNRDQYGTGVEEIRT